MAWVKLCDENELAEGEGKYVKLGEIELAVFLSRGKIYAMDNHCPHAGGAMSAGYIEGNCAVCPWHGWAFNLHNGELMDAPTVKIATYAVRVVDGIVEAELPEN